MPKFRSLPYLVVLMLVPTTGFGMNFSKRVFDANETIIMANGPINLGDDERLHTFVASLPRSTKVTGITLDSIGGNLMEGMRLARSIKSSNLIVAVPQHGMCASACFLMFAAGRKRIVSDTGQVGVHSASSDTGENTLSQSATVQMAREASQYGVPPSIIGRMVTTLATGISWLTTDELKEMGVEIIPTQQAAYQPGSPLVPGGATKATPAAPTPEVSLTFQQGRRDRINWEQWFASLADDTKSGAEWWANNRKYAAKSHLTCSMQATFSPSFISGCQRAQSLLNSADRRRLAEPDYRLGWNSL